MKLTKKKLLQVVKLIFLLFRQIFDDSEENIKTTKEKEDGNYKLKSLNSKYTNKRNFLFSQ